MRIISFIAAFAFFLVGPSIAEPTEGSISGVGAFTYHGSPVVTDAPYFAIAAAR